MRPLRAAALALASLCAGCAGWSSWEPPQEVPVRPWRAVGPDDYMVVRGDTMYSIAFRHSLDYRQLARWNGIGADYLIHPGQVLRLKAAAAPPRPRHVNGDIESVGMDDVEVVKPQPVAVNSPPLVDAGAERPDVGGAYEWTWPTAGIVVRGFGQDGSRGLTFSGREGQPVLAAAPGRVVYSGNALKGYGELIIVKHDELYLSAYGYNRARHVKEGDVVTAGQPIGEMGRGPENRPLLHFEIRRSGKPLNPAEKLPARRAS